MTGDQPLEPRERLPRNAISGLIAAVVFVVISLLTGAGATFVVVGAILVFVVATLIGFAIGTMFRQRRQA